MMVYNCTFHWYSGHCPTSQLFQTVIFLKCLCFQQQATDRIRNPLNGPLSRVSPGSATESNRIGFHFHFIYPRYTQRFIASHLMVCITNRKLMLVGVRGHVLVHRYRNVCIGIMQTPANAYQDSMASSLYAPHHIIKYTATPLRIVRSRK